MEALGCSCTSAASTRRAARESPGAILLGELIAWALAEGWRELHFLRGDEDYKYAWGATDRFNAARRLLPERNPPT